MDQAAAEGSGYDNRHFHTPGLPWGAQYVHFPYCGAELALRFLDASKVDYVVLRRGEKFTEYYEDWLKRGIPDSRAELAYVSSGENAGKFLVYRWHRPDSHPTAKPKTVLVRRLSH